MKQGRTLSELAAELERRENSKRDFVLPSNAMRIATDPDSHISTVHFAEETARVLQNTHGQIASKWDIPVKYYDRIRNNMPGLFDLTVNEHMHRKPAKRMLRTLDGEARALMSERYRCLDNFDLATVALETLARQPEMEILSCEATEHRMYIKALFPRIRDEVKVGDEVQSGIVISNSETGRGSLRVEPLVYRLICLNGMIAGTALKRYHVGRAADDIEGFEVFKDETLRADDKAFWLKVRDTIESSVDEVSFRRLVEKMRDATDAPITADPVKVVERVQKRFGLADGERSGVLTHLIQGGDLSAYGLLNAITRTSQDVPDYDRATDLERAGGTILELPRQDWEVLANAA